MALFCVAFCDDLKGVRQELIEESSAELALRKFFAQGIDGYTPNAEGFTYFKEDFFDAEKPLGSVLEISPASE